ncbi:hypothetical protein B0A49_04118 [Cryomyces minteri]|uniref:DUF7605 domain-containing protein n=1 Tax=Cryomyces minteri TaxID=331657 RepID=A0A4U0WXH4_9PEZI|nr:hypothetical protein B0A49_04118 [Cryomyces minteri]
MSTKANLKHEAGVKRKWEDDRAVEKESEPKRISSLSTLEHNEVEDSDQEEQSSDEDDDEDEDDIYVAEDKETPPNFPAYHPEFLSIGAKMSDIMSRIHLLLEASGDSDEVCSSRTDRCEELKTLPTPKPARIALLGDTGVGKSSLMNSFLDRTHLAKEACYHSVELSRRFMLMYFQGCFNTSCTCVVVEYRSKFEEQEAEYYAQVRYFDEESIKNLLREHLEDYYLFMEESSNDWTSEEKEIYHSKYLATLQTFRALFCERDEFADEQKTRGYLKAAYVEPRVVVLEKLTSWCQEQLQEYNDNKGGYSYVVEKDTIQDLAEDLDSYVMESCAAFPFKGLMLNKPGLDLKPEFSELTIADLPVGRIDRIVSHKGVQSMMDRQLKRFGIDRVALICTRTDGLEYHALARDLMTKGYNLEEYDEKTLASKSLTSQIKNRERRLVKAAPQAKGRILAEMERFKTERSEKDARRLEILVDLRNADTIEALQEKYAISRALYEHFEGEFSICLKGLQLWVKKQTLESRDELLAMVLEPQKLVNPLLVAYMSAIKAVLTTSIVSPIRENQTLMIEAGRKMCKIWGQLHSSTLQAFCRKRGIHGSRNVARQSWDDCLLQPMVQLLEPGWEKVRVTQQALIEKYLKSTITLHENMLQALKGRPDTFFLPWADLESLREKQVVKLRQLFKSYGEDFDRVIRWVIKMNAIQQSHTAYLSKSMEPVYASCAAEKGSGMRNRVATQLEDHICRLDHEGPFALVAQGVADAVDYAIQQHLPPFDDAVCKVFKEFYSIFSTMTEEEKGETPEWQTLRPKLTSLLEEIEPQRKAISALKARIAKECGGRP